MKATSLRLAVCITMGMLFFTGSPADAARKKAASETPEAQTHHIYVHVVPPEEGQDVNVVVSLGKDAAATGAVTDDVASAAPEAAQAPAEPAAPAGPRRKNMGLLFFVFVLAIFLGFELIAKVPSQLHTPLMSGSNAISGITIVGALVAAGMGHGGLTTFLGTVAVAAAMINVVGGYLVTDRMLAMFKHKGGGKS